jgi:hypothetical protein
MTIAMTALIFFGVVFLFAWRLFGPPFYRSLCDQAEIHDPGQANEPVKESASEKDAEPKAKSKKKAKRKPAKKPKRKKR